jgi:hypothetical protein
MFANAFDHASAAGMHEGVIFESVCQQEIRRKYVRAIVSSIASAGPGTALYQYKEVTLPWNTPSRN